MEFKKTKEIQKEVKWKLLFIVLCPVEKVFIIDFFFVFYFSFINDEKLLIYFFFFFFFCREKKGKFDWLSCLDAIFSGHNEASFSLWMTFFSVIFNHQNNYKRKRSWHFSRKADFTPTNIVNNTNPHGHSNNEINSYDAEENRVLKYLKRNPYTMKHYFRSETFFSVFDNFSRNS